MNIQNRYEDMANISGLSEDIIRRVMKAARQSLAVSLKQGERATLPGICTLIPEIRHKLDLETKENVAFVKIKATASNSMTSELLKISEFKSDDTLEDAEEKDVVALNIMDSKEAGEKVYPINALL